MKLIISKPLENRSYSKYKQLQNQLSDLKSTDLKLPDRFVIFTQPRSGSNLLCGMLNLHPEILCHHEIFNPQRIYYAKDFHQLLGNGETIVRQDLIRGKVGLASIVKRKLDPEQFVFKIWSNNFGHKAVGFNLFPNHIPHMSMSLIKDKNIKKIILSRRNKVKCYVSRLIAQKTGRWDSYNLSQMKNKENISVSVNASKLLRWSRKSDYYFNELQQKINKMEQNFLELSYEDLIGKHSELVKSDLLKFIGVSPAIDYLQAPLKKQNSNNLEDLIANFHELKDQLHGTELEKHLESN